MRFIILLISTLLSVICVLLALLQHYYFITRIYRSTSWNYENIIVFEDLIPTGDDLYLHELDFPIHSVNIEDDNILHDLTSILNDKSQPEKENKMLKVIPQKKKNTGTDSEVYYTLQAALAFKLAGKYTKATKLFEHACAIAPKNADVLNWYGEFLEQEHQDIVTADELYFKALTYSPNHEAALINRKRTAPVVENLDYELFKSIDSKNAYLKERMKLHSFENMKRQAYYLHIYHTVGIEGNTMTVEQLRYVLNTGQVVSGKSLLEHNEVLGLEKALQYIKLLVRYDFLGITEVLAIHRRVMGHVDPIKSGVFRNEKVFIGNHIPPPHTHITNLMENYVEWLNSEEALSMHPVRYAALAHYKLVDIHPFVDGNGRTSRLIMNLILLKAGYPPVMILKEQREKYYETLNTANLGDVRPFVRFIAQCTLQILDMYIYGTKLLSLNGVPDDLDGKSEIIRL